MGLSENHKEQLLSFIKSHYVDYHDVRLLIANDMEEDILKLMQENESLSFEDALDQAYKKYGVIGFSDVSEEYMKKINKYFIKKILFKSVKAETSKIRFWLLAILCYSLIFMIITSLKSFPLLLAVAFLIIIIAGLTLYFRKTHKKIDELKKKDEFLYLDERIVSNISLIFPITYLPLLAANLLGQLTENENLSIAIISFLAMMSFMSLYIIYFRLYKSRSQFLKAYKKNYLPEKLDFKFKVA